MRLFRMVLSILVLTITLLNTDFFSEEKLTEPKDIDITMALDEYFDYRSTQYNQEPLRSAESISISDTVLSDGESRQHLLHEMELRNEILFVSVDVTYSIQSVERSASSFDVQAIEWNKIYYQCPKSKAIEEMGFGVLHHIIIENINGTATIIKDTFSEDEITFAKSSDYVAPLNEPSLSVDVPAPQSRVSGVLDLANYNPSEAINYANTWYNSVNSSDYSYYAPELGNGSDCANFVSQCIHEGGVPYTVIPNSEYYYTEWYKDSLAWINVGSFDHLMCGTGNNGYNMSRYEAISSDYSRIAPGNPIYWLNNNRSSGHLMICTGINGDGVPYYAAHAEGNNVIGVHNMPVTNVFNSHPSLYTLEFTHRNQYTDVGTNNYHHVYCPVCQASYNEAHSWVFYTDYYITSDEAAERVVPYYICSKCGRTAPFYEIE